MSRAKSLMVARFCIPKHTPKFQSYKIQVQKELVFFNDYYFSLAPTKFIFIECASKTFQQQTIAQTIAELRTNLQLTKLAKNALCLFR